MILAHVPDSRRDKPMYGELANMTNAMQCATPLPARSKGAAVAALAKQCGKAELRTAEHQERKNARNCFLSNENL